MRTMLYSDRPAKAAQRRMVIDTCRRLSAIAPLADYQYVGFGGLEFNDFVEAHNALGIQNMTSIECNESLASRLEFNKPYGGLKILLGFARDQLPLIDWRVPAIVWLDYMDPLTRDVLRDVEYVVSQAQPGSLIAVTVQADLGARLTGRVQALTDNLADLAPNGLSDDDVTGWGVADIQQSILSEQANQYCRAAHASDIRQVLDIGYQDGAKMTTWAAVVASPTIGRVIEDCRFEDLPFVRASGSRGLRLRVPDLTRREWQFVEHAVGNGTGSQFARPGWLRPNDIKSFQEVYRYRAG